MTRVLGEYEPRKHGWRAGSACRAKSSATGAQCDTEARSSGWTRRWGNQREWQRHWVNTSRGRAGGGWGARAEPNREQRAHKATQRPETAGGRANGVAEENGEGAGQIRAAEGLVEGREHVQSQIARNGCGG
jgi:hypothetical protein